MAFFIVLVAVGMAYGVNIVLKNIITISFLSVYGLALVCSIVLQGILKLVDLDEYVDKKIITHIGSSATDYLVAFGVASINISVVVKYLVPDYCVFGVRFHFCYCLVLDYYAKVFQKLLV